ncbi:hypothetical protein PCL_08774 [Purpureocillium lilacinum]|uniref:Uncharacterized protein n=1 Tax=Purpureocillium lilacinum TaxID=33203 RepID=A0A2U3EG71_PURLI|nr:hypothetical protein PCL_08774 [Purpureocillium lilacinum]
MVVGAEAVAIDGRLGRPGGVDLDAGRRGLGGTGWDREMSRGGNGDGGRSGARGEAGEARRGMVWYGAQPGSADGGGGGGCGGGPELRVGCGGVVQTFRLVCVPGCGCVGGLWRAAARDREGRVATGRLRAATRKTIGGRTLGEHTGCTHGPRSVHRGAALTGEEPWRRPSGARGGPERSSFGAHGASLIHPVHPGTQPDLLALPVLLLLAPTPPMN